MAVLSTDLTRASLSALSNVETYERWARSQEPDIQAGLASLGFFDRPAGLDGSIAAVLRHKSKIGALIADGSWSAAVQDGVNGALFEISPSQPDVRLYALVGPARSNGSATRLAGRGLVFVWLENWLGHGATGELQDCDLQTLPNAVVHELAHAFRYSLPDSADPIAIADVHDVARVWSLSASRRIRDVMFDEGIAVRFSLEATPVALAEALGIPPPALHWLDRNWRGVLRDRERRGVLDDQPAPLEVLQDALFYDRQRLKPPFSIARAPSKWGYYVGLQWAKAIDGTWVERLRARTPQQRKPRGPKNRPGGVGSTKHSARDLQ